MLTVCLALNHNEIVFEGRIKCPLCEALEKIKDLELKIKELEEETIYG